MRALIQSFILLLYLVSNKVWLELLVCTSFVICLLIAVPFQSIDDPPLPLFSAGDENREAEKGHRMLRCHQKTFLQESDILSKT